MIEGIRHDIAGIVSTLAAGGLRNVVALLLLVLAVAFALVLHGLLAHVGERLMRGRAPYTASFLAAARPPIRLAFVVVALGLVLPALPLAPALQAALGRTLLLASIVLAGWLAIIALDLACDLYLRRFTIETADPTIGRKHVTQVHILRRAATWLVVVITAGAVLMSFDSVRQYGVSLFASAGVASIVVGLAARPVLSNLLAGVQLAISQPIRIGDSVVVESEFGTVEEIGASYVLIRLWDLRRLVVPLTYFTEKPFQNWTRQGSAILGAALLYLDYAAPVGRIRAKVEELVSGSPLWDGHTLSVQVTDMKQSCIELRVLVGSPTADACFDLRAQLREQLIEFLQRELPQALPRQRSETMASLSGPAPAPGP